MMSVHSNGGQLFWQPGAYIADGRITTPRPPLGARGVLLAVGQPDPLAGARAAGRPWSRRRTSAGRRDVLYSSAGNVREELYFNYGVFAFGWEVGGSVYNTDHRQLPGRLVPAAVGRRADLVSGHSETMEYANGIIEMFRIAADCGRDKAPATSTITPAARQ